MRPLIKGRAMLSSHGCFALRRLTNTLQVLQLKEWVRFRTLCKSLPAESAISPGGTVEPVARKVRNKGPNRYRHHSSPPDIAVRRYSFAQEIKLSPQFLTPIQHRADGWIALRRRHAIGAALLFVCGCMNANSGPLDAQLSTRLPSSVPLETPLQLSYWVTRDAYGSLYNVSTSGKVIALFENRALRAGVTEFFPSRSDPDIRLGAPIGRESFIFVGTLQPLLWLEPADYIDRSSFPRLRFDRRSLLERLNTALAGLPVGSRQMRSLDISVYA